MIDTRGIKLGIRSLAFHPNAVPGNIEQVPHYTFKVRNRDMRCIEWYGIFVYHIKPADYWTVEDTDGLKRCICAFMRTLGPNFVLATDLDEASGHLMDIALRRKTPTIYGGGGKRVLYSHLTHGIEMHVLREPDEDLLTSGGFIYRMDLGTEAGLFAFVLHRGVPLYNHLDVKYVTEAIQDHLKLQFPFIFSKGVANLHFLALRERERNQREICHVVARQLSSSRIMSS